MHYYSFNASTASVCNRFEILLFFTSYSLSSKMSEAAHWEEHLTFDIALFEGFFCM